MSILSVLIGNFLFLLIIIVFIYFVFIVTARKYSKCLYTRVINHTPNLKTYCICFDTFNGSTIPVDGSDQLFNPGDEYKLTSLDIPEEEQNEKFHPYQDIYEQGIPTDTINPFVDNHTSQRTTTFKVPETRVSDQLETTF